MKLIEDLKPESFVDIFSDDISVRIERTLHEYIIYSHPIKAPYIESSALFDASDSGRMHRGAQSLTRL